METVCKVQSDSSEAPSKSSAQSPPSMHAGESLMQVALSPDADSIEAAGPANGQRMLTAPAWDWAQEPLQSDVLHGPYEVLGSISVADVAPAVLQRRLHGINNLADRVLKTLKEEERSRPQRPCHGYTPLSGVERRKSPRSKKPDKCQRKELAQAAAANNAEAWARRVVDKRAATKEFRNRRPRKGALMEMHLGTEVGTPADLEDSFMERKTLSTMETLTCSTMEGVTLSTMEAGASDVLSRRLASGSSPSSPRAPSANSERDAKIGDSMQGDGFEGSKDQCVSQASHMGDVSSIASQPQEFMQVLARKGMEEEDAKSWWALYRQGLVQETNSSLMGGPMFLHRSHKISGSANGGLPISARCSALPPAKTAGSRGGAASRFRPRLGQQIVERPASCLSARCSPLLGRC